MATSMTSRLCKGHFLPWAWIAVFCAAAWSLPLGAQTPEAAANLDTELVTAVRDDDRPYVKRLLAAGADPHAGLLPAARTANLELLELLIESGAVPRSYAGARALALAYAEGSKPVIDLLTAAGATLEARDAAGRTVLIGLTEQGRRGSLLTAILEAGANVDATTNTGETALMAAARSGAEGAARTLLEYGATVDQRDRDGWTALMFAVRSGARKVVQALLADGADSNTHSGYGWTPLHFAVQEGDANVLRILLAAGADPNEPEPGGLSPLTAAVRSGDKPIIRLLVAAGARGGEGEPEDPRWWAQRLGRPRLLGLLPPAEAQE